MAFGSGHGIGEVLADEVWRNSRPWFEVSGIDGFGPGDSHRVEAGMIQVNVEIL